MGHPAEEDLSPDDRAALDMLRTRGLSIRSLEPEMRELLASFFRRHHVERGVSLSDLALLVGNKTSGYTSYACRELGVRPRPFEEARLKGIREKRRKYERRPFDGTDEDKAYLMGVARGDFHMTIPWKDAVKVTTSTTHPAMAELFHSLFDKHGHVYQDSRFKNDTRTFEWNLAVILDNSFGFLLMDQEESWEFVARRGSLALHYLAGIIDAEGSIGIWSNGKGTAIQVVVYNTNLSLLKFIFEVLTSRGLHPVGPYLDKKKGTTTSKYGIMRKKDYWKIALANFVEVQSLLREVPIRHREKQERRELALGITLGQPWATVEAGVKSLRRRHIEERDQFVNQAQRSYLSKHKTDASVTKAA